MENVNVLNRPHQRGQIRTPKSSKYGIQSVHNSQKGTKVFDAPAKDRIWPTISNPLQIFLRVRPPGTRRQENCLKSFDSSSVMLKGSARSGTSLGAEEVFRFSHVFDEESSQEDVFQSCAQPMVADCLNGINALIFAYGATGSGKTYSIQGTARDPGILKRSLGYILENSVNIGCDVKDFPDDVVTNIFVSSYEIYSEQIFDLLASDGMPLRRTQRRRAHNRNSSDASMNSPLKLKEMDGKVFVVGLSEHNVKSMDEGNAILNKAWQNRKVAETLCNHDSSRSHAIVEFRICISSVGANGEILKRSSRLAIVDLAGSERASRTHNTGKLLKESGNINTSLLTLGRCIEIMKNNQSSGPRSQGSRIPFRESKLTRIFHKNFTGEGKISILVAVSTVTAQYYETRSVLNFASMAKEVSTVAGTNKFVKVGRITIPDLVVEDFEEGISHGGDIDMESSTVVDDTSPTSPGMKEFLSKVEEMETYIAALESSLAASSEKIASMESDKANMEIDLRQEIVVETAEAMNSLHDSHTSSSLRMAPGHSDLDKRYSELQAKHIQLIATNDSLVEENKNLAAKNASQADEIRSLSAALTSSNSELNALRSSSSSHSHSHSHSHSPRHSSSFSTPSQTISTTFSSRRMSRTINSPTPSNPSPLRKSVLMKSSSNRPSICGMVNNQFQESLPKSSLSHSSNATPQDGNQSSTIGAVPPVRNSGRLSRPLRASRRASTRSLSNTPQSMRPDWRSPRSEVRSAAARDRLSSSSPFFMNVDDFDEIMLTPKKIGGNLNEASENRFGAAAAAGTPESRKEKEKENEKKQKKPKKTPRKKQKEIIANSEMEISSPVLLKHQPFAEMDMTSLISPPPMDIMETPRSDRTLFSHLGRALNLSSSPNKSTEGSKRKQKSDGKKKDGASRKLYSRKAALPDHSSAGTGSKK